jgi:hypothetical protein
MFPAVETVAYELTEKEKNEIKRIDNSFKSNYVLAYIFLIYKRRKAEYANVLRELRDKIPLNFIQFFFSEDESRSRKRRRIVSDTNNFENKNFDDSDFI